jgi:hypothetical protein
MDEEVERILKVNGCGLIEGTFPVICPPLFWYFVPMWDDSCYLPATIMYFEPNLSCSRHYLLSSDWCIK